MERGKSTRLDRRHFIGGSDARIIMGQDEKALMRLWQEKRGEVGPEDLSGNLIVQLGLATEDLNRAWYERNTGHAITDVQRRVRHPVIAFMGATLDGVVTETGAVYEAKFMLPWSFSEAAANARAIAIAPGGAPAPAMRRASASAASAKAGWQAMATRAPAAVWS
jgi:predicted phage-related endonuclease